MDVCWPAGTAGWASWMTNNQTGGHPGLPGAEQGGRPGPGLSGTSWPTLQDIQEEP